MKNSSRPRVGNQCIGKNIDNIVSVFWVSRITAIRASQCVEKSESKGPTVNEPPPPKQVEPNQERKTGLAKRTNYVADPNPGAIGWNGGPLAPFPALKPALVLPRVSKRLIMGSSAEGEIKHACRLVSLRSEAASVSSLG